MTTYGAVHWRMWAYAICVAVRKRARRTHRCTQREWALWHRTYIDARVPTATCVAVPYIHVRNALTYGAVRKANASNARSNQNIPLIWCMATGCQRALRSAWIRAAYTGQMHGMLAHFMVHLYIAVLCKWKTTVLSYGEALADHIVSYRDILSNIVSYLSFSLMAVSCHHYIFHNQ